MSKAALIDLDGTLSDSGLAIIKSINYALENLGYAKLQGDTCLLYTSPSPRD